MLVKVENYYLFSDDDIVLTYYGKFSRIISLISMKLVLSQNFGTKYLSTDSQKPLNTD